MTHVLIIGAGMCGVHLATLLQERGVAYVLAESRAQLGGRIRTQAVEHPPCHLDLGPAWVWPHQRRVGALIRNLGLDVFEQHTDGRLVFQDQHGATRHLDMATMGGAMRLRGGMQGLVEGAAAGLDSAAIRLGAHVERLEHSDAGVRAHVRGGDPIDASQVVLCLPPRVVAATIDASPRLPASSLEAMRAVPTWMAGHAKALAVYDTPFWRERGFNGDAISHRGPLGEIHDASPADGGAGVLFGFFGRPASWRRAAGEQMHAEVLEQLTALFGAQAGSPRVLTVTDWADDTTVSTAADEVLLREHPRYGPLPALEGPWAGRLHLSGTELAADEGGYIEGALAAAEVMAQALG